MPAPTPHRAAIALGSNIQTPEATRRSHLDAAIRALEDPPRTRVIAASEPIETEPVGPAGQGPYLNAAAILETTLSPRGLLARLLEIERSRGRDRAAEQRWGARTLDLDLLLYDDLVIDEPGLTIPHPRMRDRRFVLEPLAAIAPEWIVPGVGATVAALLERLAAREVAR
ncbi:MAG: 2-amino-4-hydroxy-6-hydroxymethyldihydropteridine diphosphokinase [Phycisphaerales bacterium]